MKKFKFMTILTIAIVLIGMLAGCDSFTSGSGSGGGTVNSNDTRNGTITLKQFLDSGPKVGFVGTPDKAGYPCIYLFENGKVYMICTWKAHGDYYYENGEEKGQKKGAITWGELAKMTDEELLSFAQEHKQLIYSYYADIYDRAFENESTTKFTTGYYTLHIYTDSTGNNFAGERIEVDQQYLYRKYTSDTTGEWRKSTSVSLLGIGKLKTSAKKAEIYDSIFSGFEDEEGNILYFRTGENLTIVFDNVGDEGVEID